MRCGRLIGAAETRKELADWHGLQPDRTGGESRQFLPDLAERLR